MASSEKQVIQLLSFLVQTEDNSVAFQPSLDESQLYKFMCALQICDENISMPIGNQLGKYINECMTTKCNENIDVFGCFGRQEAVKAELIRRGLCNSRDFAEETKEGIYAIVDPNTPRKVVLYSWQQNDSFQSDLLQQRATYALRFLTTLTSNIIVCLTSEDWNAVIVASNSMSDDENDDFTTVLKIVNEDAVEEHVACELVSIRQVQETRFHMFTGSTEDVMLVDLKCDASIKVSNLVKDIESDQAFALWLNTIIQKNRVVFPTDIPESYKSQALKQWKLHPDQLYNTDINNLNVELDKEVDRRLASFENQIINIIQQHTKSKGALSKVDKKISKTMKKVLGKCPENWSFVEYHKKNSSGQKNTALETEPESEWQADLYDYLHSCIEGEARIFFKSKIEQKQWHVAKVNAIKAKRKENDVNEAFNMAMSVKNSQCTTQDTIKIQFPNGIANIFKKAIGYSQKIDYSIEKLIPETKVHINGYSNGKSRHIAPIKIPDDATIKYVHNFGANVIIVYLRHGSTYVEIWAVGSFVKKQFAKRFPNEALLCDFNASTRSLVLQESDSTIGLYTFNDRYSLLQRTQSIFLNMMELQLPLQNLVCFGGENPGVLLVGKKGIVQMYYSQTQQYGYVMNEFAEAQSVVKMNDGKFILFLTCIPQEIENPAKNDKSTDASEANKVMEENAESDQDPDAITKINEITMENIETKDVETLPDTASMDSDAAVEDLNETEHYSSARSNFTKPAQIRIQTLISSDGSLLPETTLILPEHWAWDDVQANSYGDFLVLFNTKTRQLAFFKMTIAIGRSNFQLKAMDTEKKSTKSSHLLDCFFHVHDMFPIQAMLDEKSTAKKRLYLHIGKESSEQEDALTTVLELIMDKIKDLKKPMAKLDLVEDLDIYDISNPPDISCLESTISIWILNLVGFVPVPICRAQNNQLIILRHGAQVYYEGDATHIVARQIDFGPISYILRLWSGEVVVLTSMGKQSTGKSYYLNHVTGSSFAVSGARCTEGAWLTLRVFGNKLLVVLDFEGLGSFERSNQEDLLLAILNAGISRLTVFRIEMRFDKDIDEMFSKFQQGVSNLKGDERLYKGKLEFSIKDVNPSAANSVKREFTTKIGSLMDPSRPDNFISVMYSGEVNLTCSPPFGHIRFYKPMANMVKKLETTAKPYKNGKDFHECLSMILAKIVMADWTEMSANFHAEKAIEIRNNIRMALQYGKLEDTSLGDEVDEAIELRQATLDSKLTLPPESDFDFQLNLDDSNLDVTFVKPFFLAFFDNYVKGLRTIANDEKFDKIFEFVLWRREHRVTQWFKSLNWKDRAEQDDFNKCLDKMLKVFRRCKVKCANCSLTCFESHQHAEDVPHCCGTNHKCGGVCSFCTDKKHCGLPAGHSGLCNCKVVFPPHTCAASCQWKGMSNDCNGTCSLEIGHEGPHECGEYHRCTEKCQAPNCTECCQHFVGKNHNDHKCKAAKCIQPCSFLGCTKPCATEDHFHDPDDGYHDCMNSHNCPELCASNGICDVKVEAISYTLEQYKGKRSDFTYKQREMNGEKKLCAIVLAPGKRNHEGTSHACDVKIHKCDKRCPCCEYFCEEPFGHHPKTLHKTTHGNMKNTIFLAEQSEIAIGDRKYEAGEQGVAEWCSEFCANMGRGHVHYRKCEASSKDQCVSNIRPGRRHCTAILKPTPPTQMDEVLHKTYWNELRWEDPVASHFNVSKCPYKCLAAVHDKENPSFCQLDAWHDDLPANDARGKEIGRSIIDGHLFHCNHYRSTAHAHHVFVLDESGSMWDDWKELQRAVKTYLSHQLKQGHGSDIVSIVAFGSDSRIYCEKKPISEVNPDNIEINGGGTNFTAGLQKANAILSRNDHATYTPIILFFTDGCSWEGGDYRPIAQEIGSKYKSYHLQAHCVGFGSMDMSGLESVANGLGGKVHTSVQGSLVSTFESIAKSVTTTFSLHHNE